MNAHPALTATWRTRLTSWPARTLVAALAAAGATLAVFNATRPNLVDLHVQADIGLVDAASPTFDQLVEAYAGTRFHGDNRVEPLIDGHGTYPRLWRDLRAARQTITLQNYYAKPGGLSDTLGAILRERARAGVRVLLLMDAFGSAPLGKHWRDELRRDGVRVASLRDVEWDAMHAAAQRSHVRAIVIDGGVGYTGGFGFADYWSGPAGGIGQWRETNVRVEGPVVTQLQAAFGAAWLEATGELITGGAFFRLDADSAVRRPARAARAALLFTGARSGRTPAERFVALCVLSARKRLYVANSYFVPNAVYRRLLADAVRRGVDVRVLTTAANTDVRTARYAGRALYEQLLRDGIRIYEYQPSMMHAKTMSADGAWATIGSMNFDNRSLAFNDESTLLVKDSVFATEMERLFLEDLRRSDEITLESFRARPRRERLLELAATLLSAIL
jgi:cardiolipin synthase